MDLEKCPKCGKNSFMKVPMGRVMRESLGCMIHVADEYYWRCLDGNCGHKKERECINTKAGDHFALPWYKRIFKTF